MNHTFRTTLLTLGLLAAGIAHAESNGTMTNLTASNLKPKVGEAVSITVSGTLQPGKSCHIAGGTVSPYKDLGLISSLPITLPTTYVFNAPGPQYIHIYPGTTDVDNTCTQTGPNFVKVDVGAAGGNISGITPSSLTPKVGDQVTIKLDGTLDAGKKCHVYGGIKSPYMDLGLVSAFPTTLAKSFSFDTVGTHYIHVYVGTEDKENVCTVSASSPVKVEVAAQIKQVPIAPVTRLTPSSPVISPMQVPGPKVPK